jgi:hypothetical protein
MHVSNEKCGFPIATVEDFLQGKSNVERANASETEFEKEGLPAEQKIVVLTPAL